MMNPIPTFILGIDGGGTKTLGRLIDVETRQEWEARGGAASLTNDFEGALLNINSLIMQLLEQSGAYPEQVAATIGVAGAGSTTRAEALSYRLYLPFAQLEVCNDARTSLSGANLGQPVAMVALGTGSVGARLSQTGETSFYGGWGFQAGDEGGGAKLGLQAVKVALSELDANRALHSAVAKKISLEIGTDRNAILTWLSQASAGDFACFTQTVFGLADTCPTAKELIKWHIQHVEQLISCTVADSGLPLVLLGGLAEPSQHYLSKKYRDFLIEPKGTALDGACLIAEHIVGQCIKIGVTNNAN